MKNIKQKIKSIAVRGVNFLPEIQKRYLITWLFTLVVFLLLLLSADFDFSTAQPIYGFLMLGDIFLGGIVFLYLGVGAVAKLFTKKYFLRSATMLGILTSFTALFFVQLVRLPSADAYKANISNENNKTEASSNTNALDDEIPTPKLDLAIPKASLIPQPTPTPAPWDGKLNCNIHASCGGGSIRLVEEECAQTTCCQIGDTWSFYRDKGQCSRDQENYYHKLYDVDAYSNDYAPSPSYVPCEVYYPILGYSQTYNYMTTEQCSSAKSDANSYFVSDTQYTQSVYVPTPPPDYSYENSRCKADVRDWLRNQQTQLGSQLRALGAGSSSAYDYGMQRLQDEAERDMRDCDYQYPID